jgi:hypothetical protein
MMEKRQLLQQMLLGKLDIHMRKGETRSLSLTCANINLKRIKDINVRPETLKQLQEVVGNTLEHIGIGSNFLNRTQNAQYLRERMNK